MHASFTVPVYYLSLYEWYVHITQIIPIHPSIYAFVCLRPTNSSGYSMSLTVH